MQVTERVEEILKKTNLPIAHLAFKNYINKPPPNPPFICYKIISITYDGSDEQRNSIISATIKVELYTDCEADLSVENIVEECLSPFDYEMVSDVYIATEDLHLTAYEFDLFEKR